ncbi:MAG: TonB family protein [Burkholderiales bacterium]|nr:TonB family protein [Burkholderiales bacterium]
MDLLRPPSSDNPRVGLAASLVAHALLVTALALGVQWRSEETNAGVEAELWAATPQLAAPPQPAEPAPPPPAPPLAQATPPAPPPATEQRDAQIAIEKAKERKAELKRQALAEEERQAKRKQEQAEQAKRDRAEAERKQAAQEAKEEKAAEVQRDKLRQQQMQRLNAQLSGNGGPGGTAAQDAGPSAGYAGRIKARIKPNIVLTDEVPGNPTTEVEVTVAADGSIIGRKVVKSSGVKAWDETVLRAIDRTAVLPRDTDGRVQPRMVIAFRPQE